MLKAHVFTITAGVATRSLNDLIAEECVNQSQSVPVGLLVKAILAVQIGTIFDLVYGGQRVVSVALTGVFELVGVNIGDQLGLQVGVGDWAVTAFYEN